MVWQDVSAIPSKCAISSSTPMILEESTSSYKLRTPNVTAQFGKSTVRIFISSKFSLSGFKYDTNVSENLLQKHSAADLKLHTSEGAYGVSITHIDLLRYFHIMFLSNIWLH